MSNQNASRMSSDDRQNISNDYRNVFDSQDSESITSDSNSSSTSSTNNTSNSTSNSSDVSEESNISDEKESSRDDDLDDKYVKISVTNDSTEDISSEEDSSTTTDSEDSEKDVDISGSSEDNKSEDNIEKIEASRLRMIKLGDIYSYPDTVQNATKRLKKAIKMINDPVLIDEDREILQREIQKNKDVIEWKNGYSNLKDSANDKDISSSMNLLFSLNSRGENYFRFIVPGESVKRLTLEQQQEIGRKYTEREYLFDKKDQIRIDLARHYRYNDRMMREKIKIYQQMNKAVINLKKLFTEYGKDVMFKY